MKYLFKCTILCYIDRGMAASIGTMFGKVGALMGNILIGVFIDAYCIVPIIVSSTFLICKYKNKECNLYSYTNIISFINIVSLNI